LDYWASAITFPGRDPNVSHNPTANSVAAFDFVQRPYGAAFHPGPNGEFSIYRWTAPSTAEFAIHADFVGLGGSSTTDLHVLVNGVSIFDGAIHGPGTTAAFDTTNTLAAGSTVDFAVGPSTDGYAADTTGINARIVTAGCPQRASFCPGIGPAVG